MTQITHMIALKYRRTPRAKAWQEVTRMHMAGIENLIAAGRGLHREGLAHEWKIVQEEVSTGAAVATLARCIKGPDGTPGEVHRFREVTAALHGFPA